MYTNDETFKNDVTPYYIIKAMNVIRVENGLKELPSQMGYNYAKNVWKKDVVKNVEGKLVVRKARANKWFKNYVNNTILKIDQEVTSE